MIYFHKKFFAEKNKCSVYHKKENYRIIDEVKSRIVQLRLLHLYTQLFIVTAPEARLTRRMPPYNF